MNFFTKMERKLGRYAIRNLMRYIVIFYSFGLLLQVLPSGNIVYWRYLCLEGGAILHGQVWRVITFLIYPPIPVGGMDLLGIMLNVLIIYTYYSLGSKLERMWGAFRFNLYFLIGIIGHVAASITLHLLDPTGQILYVMEPVYLNFSLFMAFALSFPDMQFLFMMVVPIKAKYLAIAEGVIFGYMFITGDVPTKVEIGMSMLNIILFVLMSRDFRRFAPREIKRKQEFKTKSKILPAGRTRHKCAVCGRTEQDGALMEFRFCSKCRGNYEYCQDHLYTHQHITDDRPDAGTES